MEEYFDIVDENGVYTGQKATRSECHKSGLRHNAVVIFVVDPNEPRVLLQKRAHDKKMWPDLWDVSSGGHVDADELIYQAAIRECKEELGLELEPKNVIFIGGCLSRNTGEGIDDRHVNNYFVTEKPVKLEDLEFNKEEVQNITWFTDEEIYTELAKQKDGNSKLTDKQGCWEAILRYLELRDKKS